MLCYRDKTFCLASEKTCGNTACHRYFGAEEEAGAKRWWDGLDGEPPVAFSDFYASCDRQMPVVRV